MSFARKFGLRLTASLFGLAIFGLAVTFSLNSVFGTPSHLKTTLRDGGVYEVIATEIAAQLATDAHTSTDIPVDRETFHQAAKAAVTPELVQQNSEKIIDGTYAWLDGSTPTPDFQVDTAAIQQQMSANLSQAAADRLSTLPACTLAQLQHTDMSTLDPFSIPCRPPGMNTATIRQQFAQNIGTGNSLLPDEPVTANDLTSSDGQQVFAQAGHVPDVFQLGLVLPWIFGMLAILTAAVVIFFNVPRLRGVTPLSISLLITGVLLLAAMTIVSFIFRQIGASIASTGNEAGNAALTVAQTLTKQVNGPLRVFAAAYLLIGIIGLVVPRFIKPGPQPIMSPPAPDGTPNVPPAQQRTL